MNDKKLDLFSNKKEYKEYIEAEIVDDFSNHKNNRFNKHNQQNIIYKIRYKFGKAFFFVVLPVSVVFIVIGFILSSTLIGAIIGVPLLVIGFALIYLSFTLLKIIIGK